MNRHYILYIIMLFFNISIQAMNLEQIMHLEGKLYIDGSIAYGPEKYYKYFSKSCKRKVDIYEPLIQVTLIVNDIDDNKKNIESLWTNNDSPYVLNNMKELVLNENEARIPYSIKRHEDALCKNFGSGNIPDINRKFFPKFIPVHLLTETANREKTHRVRLSFYNYVVNAQCISNPNQQGICFQDNLITQLKEFIKAPRYFKWRKDKGSSTAMYIPIRKLMEQKFIKSKILPGRMSQLLKICHNEPNLCPDYCSADSNSYEHGIKGIKDSVEKLEFQFGLFLFPGILIGDPELILKMVEIRDERRQAAKEKK